MKSIINNLYLTRLIDTGKETLGFLTLMSRINTIAFTTIELPWKNNRPDESCIPPGKYKWKRYLSPHRGFEVILLENVPGRNFIEIHPANYVSQLRGCIAPGLTFGDINGDSIIDVKNSRTAFNKIMESINESGIIYIDEARKYAKK